MNSNQLRIQHKILHILKERYFNFNQQNPTFKTKRTITPLELTKEIKITEESTLILLTNLCTRNLVAKLQGDRWEYVIKEEGISAYLENLLLRERKLLIIENRRKNLPIIIALFSAIISMAVFIYSIYKIDPIKVELNEMKKKVNYFEKQLQKKSTEKNKSKLATPPHY